MNIKSTDPRFGYVAYPGCKITEQPHTKHISSQFYNYSFDKDTGLFSRWGVTKEDDPTWSQFGPEILDIEISTVCNQGCKHCYKSNESVGKNMSLETFKKIFNKLPRTLTQIAFGIGSLEAEGLELFEIMYYCRNNDYQHIVPNVTINGSGLTDERAEKLSKLCGAVAVSRYDKDICYNAVKKLTDLGMKQVNIHQVLSLESYLKCWELLYQYQEDPRLKKLNAIVFLTLKPKGRAKGTYNQLTSAPKYRTLIEYALKNKIPIGFDSCGCSNFLEAIKDHENFNEFKQLAEPCESTCFSLYVDVDGLVRPCSFCSSSDMKSEINMLDVEDFDRDVWNSEPIKEFRERLIKNDRRCPLYNLEMR